LCSNQNHLYLSKEPHPVLGKKDNNLNRISLIKIDSKEGHKGTVDLIPKNVILKAANKKYTAMNLRFRRDEAVVQPLGAPTKDKKGESDYIYDQKDIDSFTLKGLENGSDKLNYENTEYSADLENLREIEDEHFDSEDKKNYDENVWDEEDFSVVDYGSGEVINNKNSMDDPYKEDDYFMDDDYTDDEIYKTKNDFIPREEGKEDQSTMSTNLKDPQGKFEDNVNFEKKVMDNVEAETRKINDYKVNISSIAKNVSKDNDLMFDHKDEKIHVNEVDLEVSAVHTSMKASRNDSVNITKNSEANLYTSITSEPTMKREKGETVVKIDSVKTTNGDTKAYENNEYINSILKQQVNFYCSVTIIHYLFSQKRSKL
jgi:hypothetical protein